MVEPKIIAKSYQYKIPHSLCDEILKLVEHKDEKIDAKVEGIKNPDHFHRKTEIVWLPYGWYDGVLASIGGNANCNWNLDIQGGENIQVGWYGEGSHYKMHSDVNPFDLSKGYHRKVTVVLCLSDDYEGGELEFDGGETVRLRKGDIIVFPSMLSHGVKPVTNGTRVTAVKWLTGPFWR